MALRLTLSLLAVVHLAACTTPAERLSQQVALVPEADRSYMVGNYAVDCEPSGSSCAHAFNAISVYYRQTAKPEIQGRLSWIRGSMLADNTSHDYMLEAGEKGQYFCVTLPPGDYEFYTYDFYNFAGGGSGYSIPERSQFKVNFSVAPGEVVNVGKLHVTTGTGKNVFGMTLPAPGVLVLSDLTTDAVNAAQAKCPDRARRSNARPAKLSPVAPTPFVRTHQSAANMR